MEEYLGGELETTAQKLAVSSDPGSKYCHAIMLRYFMELGKTHPAVKAYLALKNKWKLQEGHPWEMIAFYRALLLEDEQEKVELLKKAAYMALAGGPTLHIIACVILGSLFYYNPNARETLEKLISMTLREIPDLSEARAAALTTQLSAPLPPLEFAKAVLPFNFR